MITTIGDGSFLDELRPVLNLGAGRFRVILVGDLKTPSSCAIAASRLKSDGFDISWFGPAEQREWLAQVPRFATFLPWNSDNRRNLGVLEAWRQGDEVIVSGSTMTTPLDAAEIRGSCGAVGGTLRAPSPIGQPLDQPLRSVGMQIPAGDLPVTIYPRGYPLSRRGTDHTRLAEERDVARATRCCIWGSGWKPDVDGATRAAVAPSEACSSPLRIGWTGRSRSAEHAEYCDRTANGSGLVVREDGPGSGRASAGALRRHGRVLCCWRWKR